MRRKSSRHTRNLYTNNSYERTIASASSSASYADVHWIGRSRDEMQAFPEGPRQNLGYALWLIQQGEEPPDYRPMPSVGPGVMELRDEDDRAWYRVMYVRRIAGAVHVLHCFEKKTKRTPVKDIDVARQRLSILEERLRKEQSNAKRRARDER